MESASLTPFLEIRNNATVRGRRNINNKPSNLNWYESVAKPLTNSLQLKLNLLPLANGTPAKINAVTTTKITSQGRVV